MILFRLIFFAARVMAAFALVFILQIQFKGQTLEQRLVRFGKKWTGAQILNQIGSDGAAALRGEKKDRALENAKTASGRAESESNPVRQLSSALEPVVKGLVESLKDELSQPPEKGSENAAARAVSEKGSAQDPGPLNPPR